MIGIPGQMAERDLDTDDAELVVQITFLELDEPVAILPAAALFHGEYEDHRIAFVLLHLVGQQHLDLDAAALILRHHAMAQEAMRIDARLRLDLCLRLGRGGEEEDNEKAAFYKAHGE